jgi:hypothetical protein
MSTKVSNKSGIPLRVMEFIDQGYTKVTITEDTIQVGWWIIQAER